MSELQDLWAKDGKTIAYYDRRKGVVDGLFTVQTFYNNQLVKVFTQLPARSGQRSKANESWVYGSPIPFSEEIKPKIFKLWLHNQLQPGEWAGHSGIGEFWRISTEDDQVTILRPDGKAKKTAVGVHPENDFYGSLACVVLVNETEAQRKKILEAREWLKKVGLHRKWIELVSL